jgi:nitrate reductase (NAD(P)H)
MLMDAGMITPPAIHIVRDHGAVPKLDWDTHTFTISGMVGTPITLTMDEIEKMPTISFPCTITCAGNRRKEQNTTKQTVGFNWGAAATGCSVWTGVRLRDVLLKAGVKTHEDGARFVCFEGADKLPNGFYGTSMPLSHAMDPTMDVILAFEQNGKRLTPDHGYPIRVIIPGWIGGRSVKWLTKIMVTEKESDNYYHYFDNRILPPQVQPPPCPPSAAACSPAAAARCSPAAAYRPHPHPMRLPAPA